MSEDSESKAKWLFWVLSWQSGRKIHSALIQLWKQGERGKPGTSAPLSCLSHLIFKIFYNEGGETLEQAAQRDGRCPIPGNIQGQIGQGSEQPDLVEDVAAYCRGIGLDDL